MVVIQMRLLLSYILVQIVTGLAGCGGHSVADRLDGIRSLIRKELVKTHMPSIAVAVAQDGRIIWEEGFG